MKKSKDASIYQIENKVSGFLNVFDVKGLLRRCNIRKRHGVAPFVLFTKVLQLSFTRESFFHDFVDEGIHGMRKDTIYAFLKCPNYNWRRFFLNLASTIIIRFFQPLTSESREKVLIADSSLYVRARSKCTELLSWVYDPIEKKSKKGFSLLTLGWSDGASFVPIDFVLKAATDSTKRINGIDERISKNTNGYKRRTEALKKATDLVIPMIKRALRNEISARYVLMDSWFAFPNFIDTIKKIQPAFDVICMLKDMPWIRYQYKGRSLRLGELYQAITKKRGLATVKASVLVRLSCGLRVRIIFCRADNKKGWVALLSTDIKIDDKEIIRQYGKRWDIEVFFKVVKSHLNLAKEIQVKSYDALIAHTTIVFTRYLLLASRQREEVDDRTIDGIFRQCIEELQDISFIEALNRIIAFVYEKLSQTKELSDEIINTLIDQFINAVETLFLQPINANSES